MCTRCVRNSVNAVLSADVRPFFCKLLLNLHPLSYRQGGAFSGQMMGMSEREPLLSTNFFFVRAPSPPPHCAAAGGGGASTSTIDGHQTISTIPKGSLIDISLLQSKRLTSACWCRRIRISIGVLGLFVYPCTRFLFSPKFYITVDAWSLSVSFHILLGEFLNI